MNPGQSKFFDYIMERVSEEKREAARSLLEESFTKQDDGSFDKTYLDQLTPKILYMIKPEFKAEVSDIMEGFASNY